jgi:hypothetical protein
MVKIGLEAVVYRLTTGTRATWGAANADGMNAGAAPGNLDEMANVSDVTGNITKGAADVSVRGNNGWAAERATLKRASYDIVMKHDPADTDFIALMKSWINNTGIALAILNDDKLTAGTQGIWADFEVFDMAKSEPLEDAQTVTFTVRPTLSAVPPEWVIIA